MDDEMMGRVNQGYYEGLKSRLTERGILTYSGEINEFDVMDFISELEYVRGLGLPKIIIILSSPGGEVHAALGLYDHLCGIIDSGTAVEVRVQGQAASAASMIVLQAASRRIATPNSWIHLHEASGWVGGASNSQIHDTHLYMKEISEKIYGILSAKTGMTIDEVVHLIERKELWLTPTKAKELNLIDEIGY